MELYAAAALAFVFLCWLFSRKGSKKAELGADEKTHPPQGPRVVGPHDIVIPAALAYQLGADVIAKSIQKQLARAGQGGTEGAARGASDDETPPDHPEP